MTKLFATIQYVPKTRKVVKRGQTLYLPLIVKRFADIQETHHINTTKTSRAEALAISKQYINARK